MGSNDSSPIMGDVVGLGVTSKPAPVGDGVIGASVPLPYVGDDVVPPSLVVFVPESLPEDVGLGVVLFVPESLPEDVGLGVVVFVPESLPEDVGLGVTPPFSDCDIVGLGVVSPSDAVGAATGGSVTTCAAADNDGEIVGHAYYFRLKR